jgi:hypothetical protein
VYRVAAEERIGAVSRATRHRPTGQLSPVIEAVVLVEIDRFEMFSLRCTRYICQFGGLSDPWGRDRRPFNTPLMVEVLLIMSEPATVKAETVIALLQAELMRLRDSSQNVWHSYMTWFTWFYTTQLVVLGLVVTKPSELKNATNLVILAAVALMMLNLFGVFQALRQFTFNRAQRRRAGRICQQLTAFAEQHGISMEITSGFSNELVNGALLMFMVALFMGLVLWLYVLITQPFA